MVEVNCVRRAFEMSEETEALLQRLSHWVDEQPDKKIWTFLDDKGEPSDDYTYKVHRSH